jgi:hypothetical protein
MEEVIIKVHVSSEGTLMYSVYIDPPEVDGLEDGEDGGECTSGTDNMDVPHSPKDWENALGMAVDAALDLIKRKV